ncbi:uncharacterized protein LTR77_006751 [Saxophila tyrrhenica]|uniref:Monooxygenase n=1 Tax=Saxophila tyrrhenica TaxID=1690608 RepID=A0AAV9P674_9PEZI|nr:hypothetical protein LTR77_006751 [Saxophila tyrrhenica]
MDEKNVIIVGAGVAGIAMAHTLKHKLGVTDFEIYDKSGGIGGTWRANTYPGCGSDVPVHLYSFSFNLNPDWTHALADQEEILRYIEATVDKFDLRSHFRLRQECSGAKWDGKQWIVSFVDHNTGRTTTKRCRILLTAVGGFSRPRRTKFPGMEGFKGRIFHTAEWDHSFDYTGKRVAVIGNGCSAAQVVPSIAPAVQSLTQYARSPQWYHERPNRTFSTFDKFCFRYLPLWQRWHRLDLFLQTDELATVYGPSEEQVRKRRAIEETARQYIYRETPKKYHSIIVPDFPLGCKRRIYDPGYLESLHHEHVELLPEGLQRMTENGIVSESGDEREFDAIILATGFEVSAFLTPMKIIGKKGQSLEHQWQENRGAQAYMGSFVHNHPNLAVLFGPNTFPAFNSVIYSIEVQVEYIARTLIEPIMDGYSDVIEVRQEAEAKSIRELDEVLQTTVFAAGCSNWYINKAGRNSAAWPGLASSYWKATFFTKWQDFTMEGGSSTWLVKQGWRRLKYAGSHVLLYVVATAAAAYTFQRPAVLSALVSG